MTTNQVQLGVITAQLNSHVFPPQPTAIVCNGIENSLKMWSKNTVKVKIF